MLLQFLFQLSNGSVFGSKSFLQHPLLLLHQVSVSLYVLRPLFKLTQLFLQSLNLLSINLLLLFTLFKVSNLLILLKTFSIYFQDLLILLLFLRFKYGFVIRHQFGAQLTHFTFVIKVHLVHLLALIDQVRSQLIGFLTLVD